MDTKHTQYSKNQLADVICQLRFPEILSINTTPPADFQDQIRIQYPQFSTNHEVSPPKIVGIPGNMQVATQPATVNYQFTSQDGNWRVNLTSKFISLSCAQYTNWEAFAKQLDAPLAAFIKIYMPAYFERIGLRYLNVISRIALGLDNLPFSFLFQPPYLGILAQETVAERDTVRSSVDAEASLAGGCHLKLHAGPGMICRNGMQDDEIKFIFDQDLFMPANIPVNYAAGALETLHDQAVPIFRAAITDTLHNAMEPQE